MMSTYSKKILKVLQESRECLPTATFIARATGLTARTVEVNLPTLYQTLYLDYVNDFITIERWAEHYGLSDEIAEYVYSVGKTVNETQAAKAKRLARA